MDLHFICRHGENHTRLGQEFYETGNWVVNEGTANEAVGGRVYLHEKQDEPAWHGGTIIEWRTSAKDPDRKIFKYWVDGPFRVKCRQGWGREKAIVRS